MSIFRAYRPGRHRPRPLRAGVILAAILVVLLYAGYSRSIPFLPEGGDKVTARFQDASHIQSGAEVRVAGVSVGKVTDVERHTGPGGGADVTMRIDSDQDVDLRADARAGVYWRTLLGRNMYVDLQPGHAKAPLQGDIPLARTEVQVEADQALQPYGRNQRRAIKDIITAFDDGTKNADAINRTIDEAGPALRNARTGLASLRGSRAGNLTTVVKETSKLLGALDASDDQLAGLVDDGRVALGVTAAQSDAIGSILDQAPATMDDATATYARLRTTLGIFDPLSEELQPGAKAIPAAAKAAKPAMVQLDKVLEDAEPTLRDLRPAATRLAGTVDPAIATIEGLKPTVDRSNDDLLPWLASKDSDTKLPNYTAIGAFFSAVSSAASPLDANGFMLNFQAAPSERVLLDSPCVTRLGDPSASPEEKVNCEALSRILQAFTGQGFPGASALSSLKGRSGASARSAVKDRDTARAAATTRSGR
jgi:virulence factor Mce-like protein